MLSISLELRFQIIPKRTRQQYRNLVLLIKIWWRRLWPQALHWKSSSLAIYQMSSKYYKVYNFAKWTSCFSFGLRNYSLVACLSYTCHAPFPCPGLCLTPSSTTDILKLLSFSTPSIYTRGGKLVWRYVPKITFSFLFERAIKFWKIFYLFNIVTKKLLLLYCIINVLI